MTSVGPSSVDRFGIGIGVGQSRRHAVDLRTAGSHIAQIGGPGSRRPGGTALSVCGEPADLIPNWGSFTYDSRWLASGRCQRCGWIVALHLGTVEREIDWYTSATTARAAIMETGQDPDLLAHIFTAVLADAPAGRDIEPGYRSELLAHAARHAPAVLMCEECTETGSAVQVHGAAMTRCPETMVICKACTLMAGPWAGEWEGFAVDECLVSSPCSALTAMARHYGLIEDDHDTAGRAVCSAGRLDELRGA